MLTPIGKPRSILVHLFTPPPDSASISELFEGHLRTMPNSVTATAPSCPSPHSSATGTFYTGRRNVLRPILFNLCP